LGNVRAACQLELRPGQEGVVAPVAWSLADAYAAPPGVAWPRLVYDGDELVGFLMVGFFGLPAHRRPQPRRDRR
jgi:diamine N-acetyltransferase